MTDASIVKTSFRPRIQGILVRPVFFVVDSLLMDGEADIALNGNAAMPVPPIEPEINNLPGQANARIVEIQVEVNAAGNRIIRPVHPPPVWANMMNQPRYAQNHVFRALFFRAARTYTSYFPYSIRRALEFVLLVQAVLFLIMLTYVHVNYGHLSLPCLVNKSFIVEDGFQESTYARIEIIEPPKYGVLRIEVLEEPPKENYSLVDSYLKEFRASDVLENWQENITTSENETESWVRVVVDTFKPDVTLFNSHHVVEFAEDYGLLRLSPRARRALNVSVLLAVVTMNDSCIGSWLDRCILAELLGMDEIVIASIRNILPNSTRRGFVRNVITGETYRFVPASIFASGSLPPIFSLLVAAVVMLLFTVLVALLLRYSHHQIYACVVDALSSFEQPNANRGHNSFRLIIPIVPLLVIVLAMVGLETVMAEFFQDSPTAFYVIVTIWLADQYYALACHSPASRKWWPRFFFAYHFAFYAYYCRFSGQFGQLALAASWLFVQHSMLFFIHHFELPAIEHARE